MCECSAAVQYRDGDRISEREERNPDSPRWVMRKTSLGCISGHGDIALAQSGLNEDEVRKYIREQEEADKKQGELEFK